MTQKCDKCGKELKEGITAFGITTGVVDPDYDGLFTADNLAWVMLLCASCAEHWLKVINTDNDKAN